MAISESLGQQKQVQLELDEAGLDRVLEQLEKINSVVQDYSSAAS